MNEIKNYFPKLLVIILLSFISSSVTSSAIAGEIYKWKDKNGNVFFSDTPPAGVHAEVIPLKDEPAPNFVTTPEVNSVKPKSRITEEKRPYSSIKVIMYMTSWCGYCRKAREYLQSLRVDLVEYDVERNPSMEKEMLSKSRGARGVPLIDVEGIIIHGYSLGGIKDAVEKRRSS
ncbi:MAG: glutaredoxin domain-containing protein [Thermodesulfobacteriota bacterium]|jgi:glutaredoxin